MIIVGLLCCLNHLQLFFYTRTEDAKRRKKSLEPKVSFGAVFASFFKKNKLGSYWLYYYSVGRIPVTKLTPFLIDDISVGGMGLTTQDVGIIYGFRITCINYRRNNWRNVISKTVLVNGCSL
jgi:PAT family beta-lactamase induction signal transducer AmpG